MKTVTRPCDAAILLALLTAGCQAPPSTFVRQELNAPPAFASSTSQEPATPLSETWWTMFADPELDQLVTAALSHSSSLALAAARVEEARARFGLARTEISPSVTTTAVAQVAGESATRTVPTPTGPLRYRQRGDAYRVPVDVAYEVDLWGRVRRASESAEASLTAALADAAAVRLSLTAEVASTHFSAHALRHEAATLEQAVRLRRDQMELLQQRVAAGLTNELDLSRARVEAAAAEAELAGVHGLLEQRLNTLVLLTGRAAPIAANTRANLAPPGIAPGLPSQLLQRRPDLAAAEARLQARTADLGVARTGYFPTLRLTGAAGFESQELGNLLQRPAQFWAIAPSLYFPWFDGGRTDAQAAAAEARAHAALAEFRERALIAFAEVEESLIALRQQDAQRIAQTRALTAARDSASIASARYEQGLLSYLEVIDAERTVLATERTLVQLTGLQLVTTTRLVKALGGGWSGLD